MVSLISFHENHYCIRVIIESIYIYTYIFISMSIYIYKSKLSLRTRLSSRKPRQDRTPAESRRSGLELPGGQAGHGFRGLEGLEFRV